MGAKRNRDGAPHGASVQGVRPVVAPAASPPDRAASPSDKEVGGATIRAGTEADAGAAASLHAGQISEGFLALLGTPFLRRLYRRICRTPRSFLIIAECDGTPCGFVAGSADVKGLYREFLLHDGIPGALRAAPRVLWGWRRVIETLRHGSSSGVSRGKGVEMLSLAVDPAFQGRGIGRLLVESFFTEIAARGETAAYLVAGGERGAIALFLGYGFEIVDRFELHPGTESVLMQWEGGTPGESNPGPG